MPSKWASSLGCPVVASNPLSLPKRLWRDHGQTLIRFSRVSMVNIVVGQSLLFTFHSVLGWPGAFANAAAVAISSWPAYWLSRHYVWEQDQGGHTVGEIAPFWILSFAGLFLSTAVVGVVDSIFGGALSVQLANAGAFTALWIVRYMVFHHVIWGDRPERGDSATGS